MELEITYLGALAAGILSFLSPCVLPLVPPYLCFLAGTSLDQISGEGETVGAVSGRVFLSAILFVMGFTVVFVALGASASAVSGYLTDNLSWLAKIAGALIILMGLHFLGVFRFAFLNREVRYHPESRPVGTLGAFLIGVAFAFGWTPCIGPVLGTILAVAGSSDQVSYGASLLGVYSLGIGIPFMASALFVKPFLRFMTRFRRHIGLVEKVMGALLVATGILFLTGALSEFSYLLLEMFPALANIG